MKESFKHKLLSLQLIITNSYRMKRPHISKSKIWFLILFIFPVLGIAQSSVNTAGSAVLASGFSVDYSVGQLVYQSHFGSNATVMEGVQLPSEIWVVNIFENELYQDFKFRLFPNPTSSYVNLTAIIKEAEMPQIENYSYALFNQWGVLINKTEIAGITTQISLAELSAGIYYLNLFYKSKQIQVIRIHKVR